MEMGVSSRLDHIFPILTPAQLARLAVHGRARSVARGEVLVEPGTPNVPMFVVTSGRLEAVRALEDGDTIVIATGATYRTLDIPNIGEFEGSGVHYGATFMEAQLCTGEDVVVVGGGNSAGQAAVFLAQTARHVHLLVRSQGLTELMSRYLIRRIEENPAITLHTHTEVTGLDGDGHLERIRMSNRGNGR